jgi:hypothetical protein
MFKLFTVLVCVILIWSFRPVECSEKTGRALTRSEVATTWVGISEDELVLVRLTLRAPDGGQIAYSFLDAPPDVSEISSWNYEPKKNSTLRLLLGDQGNRSLQPALGGSVVGVRMQLVLVEGDWQRTVTLRREGELVYRWNLLREAMKSRTGSN